MIEHGEKITGVTDKGLGIGTVHTVDKDRFFAQLRVRGGPVVNRYFRHDEEGTTWVRGEQDEISQSASDGRDQDHP